MTTPIQRHQAGAPASQGGEFKTHTHSESDITLAPRNWGATNIEEGSHTPWGVADYVVQVADGITSANTPGHGGIKLSAERQRAVHPALRVKGGWYEEDCDEAIVSFTFPEDTRPTVAKGYSSDVPLEEHIASTDVRVRNYYPDGWEAATGKTLQPGESRTRDENNWLAAHADDYIVSSANGDPDDPNLVLVTAVRRGDEPDTQKFRIPLDEYKNKEKEPGQSYRFAVDPNKYAALPKAPEPAKVPAKRYSGFRDDVKLTASAQERVNRDLSKRWGLKDGTIRTGAEIIEKGISGKTMYATNGKREYYLEQKLFENEPSTTILKVSKATWDAVVAPDTRTPVDQIRTEINIVNDELEVLDAQTRGYRSPTRERQAKRAKLLQKLSDLGTELDNV